MKKLHIAMVTIADLPQGGGNTLRLRRLVETLTGSGHRVSIWNQHRLGVAPVDLLATRGEFGGGSFEYVLDRLQRGSGPGIVGDKLRAVKILAGRIRREAPEVVWFNNLSFYDTWPLTRVARSLGIATIQAYEDERLELTSREELTLSRRLFGLNAWLGDRLCPRMADAVVVISSVLKEKYRNLGVPSERLYTIPTVIDCRAWECPPEQKNDQAILLYAGAFAEQDEVENIIRALGLLRDQGHSFQVVMLGDNLRDPALVGRARELVAEHELVERVAFGGFVPSDEVKSAVCSANILLAVRRGGSFARSGLSTKLSEYLASGRAVVASRVGDVTEYLADGESALLVSPEPSPEEIAGAVQRLLQSEPLRARLGKAGRQVARTHFDRQVVGAALQAVLDGIVA